MGDNLLTFLFELLICIVLLVVLWFASYWIGEGAHAVAHRFYEGWVHWTP